MLKIVLLVSVALPCVLAVFNTPFGDNFPAIGPLLQCVEDGELTPTIGLQYTEPNITYLPVTSGYAYPRVLETIGFNPGFQMLNQININMVYQSLSRPNFSDILYFPERYDPTHPDRAGLEAICGEDVLANVRDGNSTRNEDQGTWMDITNTLNDSWIEILNAGIEGLPADQVMPFRESWEGEIVPFFEAMIQLLSCRVAFGWADAGPTFFPRYFRQGFCYNRRCSMPDRDEFRCHADLSFDSFSTLEAGRWDCCWTFDQQVGFKFQCGFRRVNIPIVCDCDCRCIDKAGI